VAQAGHALGLGIGIATGYATLGRIGYEGRFDYAAIGSVVNLAARLCAEASDRSIVLDQRALAEVEEVVEARGLGSLALKGFSRPVRAFDITGIRPGAL
jgi:adenylate cyclase